MASPASSSPLDTLGLGGDGDEIAAIAEVEHQFGVRLDYTDASEWRTTGDVFAALLQALPSGSRDSKNDWQRFAQAIARETGVDPNRVSSSTLLIGKPIPHRRLWFFGVIAGLAAAAYKALT